MRHRRLAGGLAVAGLVDDQRLAGVPRLARRFEKAPAILDAFQQADDRPGVVVLGEIGDEVADIDIAGIARREIVREADAALHALQHGIAQRAALRHDSDRASTMTHGGIVRHEIQSGLRSRIGETDAIRPDHPHAGAMRERDQTLLRLDTIRFRGLGKTGRVDHDAARTGRRGALDHTLDHRPRDAEHHAIGALRQVGQRRHAGAPEQRLILRIDRKDLAGEARHVGQRTLAERTTRFRCADDRDDLGIDEAREVGRPVERPC